MTSENGRSDDYWMGVRDALRMVDSFLRWSKRNEGKAKPIEEFLHDGLVAAAKRCEQCLSHKLGVSFSSEVERERVADEAFRDDLIESPTDDDILEESELDESVSEELASEIELDVDGIDNSEDIAIMHDEVSEEDTIYDTEVSDEIETEDSETKAMGEESIEPVSLDFMIPKEGSMTADDILEGEPRDFGTDFDFDEPEPLVVEADQDEPEDVPVSEDEDKEFEASPSIAEPTPPPNEDDESFTWKDYEEEMDKVSDIHSDETSTPVEEDEANLEEKPKAWSPMDEPPSLPDEARESEEDNDTESSEEETDESQTPPPPPPPPEQDETEEERRRRARRLFFGA